jgi:hypothetical protein
MEVETSIDETIYVIRCPHRVDLTLEDSVWCDECQEWIEGDEVGDLTVWWEKDGQINVGGSGYAPYPSSETE